MRPPPHWPRLRACGCPSRRPPAAPLVPLRSRLAALAACVLLALASLPAAGAEPPLVLGLFPHLTPRQIIETYHPLVDALERRMGRPVALFSARDFRTFVERTRRGEYDLVLTAPHLAWLAQQAPGYRPLLKYAHPPRGLLVVRADSPFDQPSALRGRTIATSDASALAVLAIQGELAGHGLKRDVDYRTAEAGTHLNAVMQVVNGRADAAVLGLHPYKLMPPDLREPLRVIAETPPLSGLMFLVHPRLAEREAQAIRKALLHFGASPAGQAFLQRGGYGGFAAVDGSELHAFRAYALQVQEMLEAAR